MFWSLGFGYLNLFRIQKFEFGISVITLTLTLSLDGRGFKVRMKNKHSIYMGYASTYSTLGRWVKASFTFSAG